MRFPGIGFRKSKDLWEIAEKRRTRSLNTKISTSRRQASMRPVCSSFHRARSPGSNWIQAPHSNAMVPNGYGFPSSRSGLIVYADSVGLKSMGPHPALDYSPRLFAYRFGLTARVIVDDQDAGQGFFPSRAIPPTHSRG